MADLTIYESPIQNRFGAPSVEEMRNALLSYSKNDVMKAWKTLSDGEAVRSPKSAFADPLTLMYALGYKDRRFSLSYQILKRISMQLSLISAIINTRINQVASFSQPFRLKRDVGFQIKHKDENHNLTKSEQAFIRELEDFISCCGRPLQNPFWSGRRDDFDSFLKKIVRDRLTYDQVTFEIIPDSLGRPFEFIATDASTIRVATDELIRTLSFKDVPYKDYSYIEVAGAIPYDRPAIKLGGETSIGKYLDFQDIRYVQVINGQIVQVYREDELGFCISNPRTDVYIQGYGLSEIEQLINIVTAHLYAEEYNRRFFQQGSAPKGIINIKSMDVTPEQLESFRRQWHAMVSGVENSWKTPILQAAEMEYHDLHTTNRDMEFDAWMEYLIKITCAVFLIDPAEVNFDVRGASLSQSLVFESSNEQQLKKSRDRGLRPLLKFVAKCINNFILSRLAPDYYLEFVGLDELSPQEKISLLQEKVTTFMTINEARAEQHLPSLGDAGDIILNPTFVQHVQSVNQMEFQQHELALKTEQENRRFSAEQIEAAKEERKEQLGGGQQTQGLQSAQAAVTAQPQTEVGQTKSLKEITGNYIENLLKSNTDCFQDLDDYLETIKEDKGRI